MMTLDVALPLVGAVLAAPLALLLIARRVSRALPTFVAYMVYTFFTCLASVWAVNCAPGVYLYFWAPCICVDLIFCLCVLVELGRNVLIHNRTGDSQWLIPALVFPFITLLFWSLAPWPNLPMSGWIWQLNLRALQTTAVLQMSGLFTLVTWSSWRRLRWPERELHVITGVGVWTVVQFAVLIVHTHGLFGGRYRWLDLLTPAGCVLVNVYWLHYFWLEPSQTAVPGERNFVEATSTRKHDGADPLVIPPVM
jgi:hypothetical protein